MVFYLFFWMILNSKILFLYSNDTKQTKNSPSFFRLNLKYPTAKNYVVFISFNFKIIIKQIISFYFKKIIMQLDNFYEYCN